MALKNLPAADFFTGGSVTNIQAKNAQNDTLAFIRQSMLGGSDEYESTISSGSITPDGAVLSVDTEGDASSDNLDNIVLTNIQDGGFLLLRAENAGRTVVIRHGQGGTGQILTHDGQNIILDEITKFVLLRRDGNDIREVFRTSQGVLRKAMPAIKTDNYTVTIADIGMMLIMNSSSAKAFTLPTINSEIDGAVIMLKNIGTGTLTLTPSGGNSIDVTSLQQGNVVIVVADNTNSRWRTLTDNIASDAFSQAPISIKTANYSVVDADAGKYLVMNSGTARTFTLPAISSSNDGKVFMLKSIGSATTTVAKTGGDTLEVTSLLQGDAVVLQADNANKAWRFIAYYTKAFPTGLNMSGQVKGTMLWYTGTAWAVLAAPSDENLSLVSEEDDPGVYVPVWKVPPSGRKEFTTPGADTFTVPLDVTMLFITMAGGGGGGGCVNAQGGSGGGGGGGCVRFPVRVIPGQTYNLNVGAGGAGHTGSVTGAGSNGTDSDFQAEDVTLTGGGGAGAGSGANSGGNGGAFSSSEVDATGAGANQSGGTTGAAGGKVPFDVSGLVFDGGDGGDSQGDNTGGAGGGGSLGRGGDGGDNGGSGSGENGKNYGGGGGGGGEDATVAGDGANGVVIVAW